MSIYNLTKTKQMKITEKDLIGDIKDFPIEAVEKMIERQVEQGNEADVSVFQECSREYRRMGGFSWFSATEGISFWVEVIENKNFDLFFEKYPKQTVNQYPKVMEVSCDGVKWCRRVVFMEKKGCFLAWVNAKTIEEAEKDVCVSTWKYARDIKPTLTVTKAEIAEKFGVKVEQLIIKD